MSASNKTVERRTAAGLCQRCGGQAPKAERKTCETCLERERARDHARRGKHGPRAGTVLKRRPKPAIAWQFTRTSAQDARCGRCKTRMRGDIEHACPFAPEPVT